MSKVKRYLLASLFSTFSSLFFTLFLIISIVFFIQISRLTAYIEISFSELIKLYLFMLPRILLFCVPIAFFVSLAMTLFRLSRENESIVLFSLGYSPFKMGKFFMGVAGILSAIMLAIALVLIPIASELNSNFIDYKKSVAKLNLKPSEFGQKFSEWMIFIEGAQEVTGGTSYEGVTMYNGAELLITATSAKLINEGGTAILQLSNGEIYRLNDENVSQSSFESMDIRTRLGGNSLSGVSVAKYWAQASSSVKRRIDLSTYVLVALFPLCSTLFAISLGVITQRYEKGMVYIGIFGVLFSYFALIMLLGHNPALAISLVPILFLSLGAVVFRYRILRRY